MDGLYFSYANYIYYAYYENFRIDLNSNKVRRFDNVDA